MSNSEYYDQDGWLRVHANVDNEENLIKATVEEHFLSGKSVSDKVKQFLSLAERSKRHTKYKLSHDNLTSSYAIDDPELDAYKELCREKLSSKHPRDWAYYNIREGNGKWYDYLLLSVVMTWSCFFKYQWVKEGDGSPGNPVRRFRKVDTSGKLLVWTRLKSSINMPLTKKICNALVKWHFKGWKGVFDVYYEDGHRLRQFPASAYEI